MKAKSPEAVQQTSGRTTQIKLDLTGVYPRLSGEVLTLEMTEFSLEGPLVTQEIRQQLVNRGLAAWEVDALVDDFYQQLSNQLFAKFLVTRRQQ